MIIRLTTLNINLLFLFTIGLFLVSAGEYHANINIENVEYENMIKYIDELFKRTNQEVMNMTFFDFISIFGGGINNLYITDGDVTIVE